MSSDAEEKEAQRARARDLQQVSGTMSVSGSDKSVRRRVITPTSDPHNTDPLLRQRNSHLYEQNKPNGCERAFVEYNKIKWFWAPAFFGFWLLLYVAISIPACHRLPRPLSIKDEAKYPDRFIAERAEINLQQLVALGPRVVGSKENEMGAVKVLSGNVQKIRSGLGSANDIEVDVQVASGSYVHWTMINMYQSIQNIVVKVSPKGTNSTTYLLVNSHYDSVPGGPGAGDDGSMVATMMETLRVLAQSKQALKHPVVFLFNGAEENPLQASHAFITQHKWAKNCKALINLDSAGNGGREILFQSGPNHPWLMKSYRRAIKHPYASTMAEEMFQNNFIPSDTDFRIFRDHGAVPGLDMAYQYNGYVYHTRFDRPEIFPRGSFQNTGDNLLALVREIANSQELEDTSKHAEGHTVYFDVMGWFLVFYTETEGIILNVIVSLVAIGTCLYAFKLMASNSGIKLEKIFKRVMHTFVVQLFAVITAVTLTVFLGWFMDLVHLPMSWFTHSWLILGLYFTTFIFGLAIVPALYYHYTQHDKLPIGQRVQMLLHCHCLFLAIFTIVLTICGVRSVFVLMLSCLFYTMALIINLATKLHSKDVAWVIPHIICGVPPFVFFAYFSHGFFLTFIPMFGRFGENVNPDLVVAVFSIAVGLLTCGFIVPVLHLFRKSKTIICALLAITFVCVIIAITPMGFPYRPKTSVQRFSVLHAKRTFHDADNKVRRQESGYFIMPQDRRTYSVKHDVINMTLAQKIGDDCQKEMMCGLPLYNQRWHKTRQNTLWIPASEPLLGSVPAVKVISKKQVSPSKIRYELQLSGPDHMALFIQPLNGAIMKDWSFHQAPLRLSFQPPYFIYFSWGVNGDPLNFWLELEKPKGDFKTPTFELGLGGHWTHHKEMLTPDFEKFLESFPKYVDATPWPASYETWIY
ncbi:endoplasmic reticulum metallopeptidase 1 isoform X5 [Drosophila miranda]|uniref:endoplasmic reticulum metallopeptidase 1 isoform X5 n=2 Tax=Drosophila miranda TaxID=7229 RepID=UPI0007E867A0|nr:endoplasmic reticulum metallopeptidase 1 isoform X5 [Drosophila miranda]